MASLKDIFKSTKERLKQKVFLTGSNTTIRDFGDDVYKMDTARQALERITLHMSKLDPRHIIRDPRTRVITPVKGDIARVLHAPNEFMTAADFIKKQVYYLYKYDNAYILPQWRYNNDGRTRTLEALYPIETGSVEFKESAEGTLWCQFRYKGGFEGLAPYTDLIHLRRVFTSHEIQGGNRYGEAERSGLLETCRVQDKILQGVAKQAAVSSAYGAIVSGDSYLSDAELSRMKEDFLSRLAAGDNAFLFLDKKQEVNQLSNGGGKFVDADTIKYLNEKILHDFGVSAAIWSSDFNPEQLAAFNEITIEPLVNTFNQAYSKTLLTPNERAFGNEIIFYHNKLKDADLKWKIEVIKEVGGRGALSNDQILELLDLPPVGGEIGSKYMQSLNYINVNDAREYQLKLTQLPKISDNKNEVTT